MKPIKWIITKERETVEREVEQIVNWEIHMATETVNSSVDVKTYYLPEDAGYEEAVYDPKQCGRLFDNEEQAIKAGFTRVQ